MLISLFRVGQTFYPHPSLSMAGSPVNTGIDLSEGLSRPLTNPSLAPSLGASSLGQAVIARFLFWSVGSGLFVR